MPKRIAVLIILPMLLLPAQGPGAGSSRSEGAPPAAVQKDIPWPVFAADQHHSGMARAGLKGITDPMKRYDPNRTVDTLATVIGNFSGNIASEGAAPPAGMGIVYGDGNRLYITEGATGRSMWEAVLPEPVQGSPALGDPDGDGKLEVVLASTTGNISSYEPVIRYNASGYSWNSTNTVSERAWLYGAGASNPFSSPALGDINGDGTVDVVAAVSGKVVALNGTTGAPLWAAPAPLPANTTSSPALAEFGKKLRIAVLSFDLPQGKEFATLLADTGDLLWEKEFNLSASPFGVVQVPPSATVADVQGDGAMEVVVPTPFENNHGKVYVYGMDGTEKWSKGVTGQIEATPAAGDIDGDGKVELVVASWNETVTLPPNFRVHATALNGEDGSQAWTAILDSSRLTTVLELAVASPALADMNRDGLPDVILATYDSVIYAMNGSSGGALWNLSLQHINPLTTSPALGDADLNGYMDIAVDGVLVSHRIPDLEIGPSDITFDRESANETENVSISALVHNPGTRDTQGVVVRFYDTYAGDTVELGNRTVDVPAGRSAGALLGWQAAGGGSHTITAAADPENLVEESSEANNRAAAPFTVHSPYALSLACPQNESVVDAGGQARYVLVAKNLGEKVNDISFAVSSSPPQGWSVLLSAAGAVLGPGEETSIQLTVVTAQSALAGDYRINATAQSRNATANRATVTTTTTVRGMFGVKLTPDRQERNLTAGGVLLTAFNLSNTGNTADTVDISVSASTDPQANWTVAAGAGTVSISGRGWYNLTVLVQPPAGAPEGYRCTVDILAVSRGDPSKRDSATLTVAVVKPDLAVASIRFFRADGVEADGVTKHLIDGRNGTVGASITNLRHNVPLERVGVSLAELVGLSTLPLGTGEVAVLPQDGEGEARFNWSGTAGDHLFRAVADPANGVAESEEGNNELLRQTTVKSRTPVGGYNVNGTVFDPDGRPVANALVVVMNSRTNESLRVHADGTGRYAAGLSSLTGGYEEEERIVLIGSDGLYSGYADFLAYSEDGGRTVDIRLSAEPHDYILLAENARRADPGGTAVFNITVQNIGGVATSVEVSAAAQTAGYAAIFTLANGTARNVTVSLAPAGSTYLYLCVTVPAGARAGTIGKVQVNSTSLNDSHKTRALPLTVTVNQVFGVKGRGEPVGTVRPGWKGTANLSVNNTGNGADNISIEVVSVPPGWKASLNSTAVDVQPLSSARVELSVDVPATAVEAAYNITVNLTSNGARSAGTNATAAANITVTVESLRYGARLTLASSGIIENSAPGTTEPFSLKLANNGTAPDRFTVTVSEESTPRTSWATTLAGLPGTSATDIPLERGAAADLSFTVKIPDTPGTNREAAFAITATSQNDGSARSWVLVQVKVAAPDLRAMKVTFSPRTGAKAGDRVTVTLAVDNGGTSASPPVKVAFYDGTKAIGEATLVPVEAGGNGTVSLKWEASEGRHRVKAVVNPQGASRAAEFSFDNNIVSSDISVDEAGDAGGICLLIVLVFAVGGGYAVWRQRRRPPAPERKAGGEEEEEKTPKRRGRQEEDEGDRETPVTDSDVDEGPGITRM